MTVEETRKSSRHKKNPPSSYCELSNEEENDEDIIMSMSTGRSCNNDDDDDDSSIEMDVDGTGLFKKVPKKVTQGLSQLSPTEKSPFVKKVEIYNDRNATTNSTKNRSMKQSLITSSIDKKPSPKGTSTNKGKRKVSDAYTSDDSSDDDDDLELLSYFTIQKATIRRYV